MNEEDRQLLKEIVARLLRLPLQRWRHTLFCFLVTCVLFESAIVFFKFDFFKSLAQCFGFLSGPALSVLSLLVTLYAAYSQHSKNTPSPRENAPSSASPTSVGGNMSSGQRHSSSSHPEPTQGETMCGRAVGFVISSLAKLRTGGLSSLLILSFMWILAPSCIAHYKPCSHLITYVVAVCEQAVSETADGQVSEPDGSPAPEQPQDSDLPRIDAPSAVPNEDTGFLQDPDALWELSSEDHDKIYYQTTEYLIENWSDQEKVVQTVARLIADLRAVAAPNTFDAQAPSSLAAEVAQADTDYEQMAHSSQLDQTIDIHLRAWEYPKYSIAFLLSNEYQKYGLEYYFSQGPFGTIEYYYGQSILWCHRALTFASVSDYQVQVLLSYISYRYHDIADVAPDNSAVQLKATVLYKAYDSIRTLEF